MRIAIHESKGSFSDRWIEYCKEKKISYKIVDAYDSDIIAKISDCDIFMWHFHHADYRDIMFAKQLLFSIQISGKKVFPDFYTSWFFDDKIGQKYLLESIGAPLVPTYIFYTKRTALSWVDNISFPKVFKLRKGAGAVNVKQLRSKKEARRIVRKIFDKGFHPKNSTENINEAWRKYKLGRFTLKGVVFKIYNYLFPPLFLRMLPTEKGYFYVQDFIPDNLFDIRIIVIDNKAFGIKRKNRKNDFRASGSGEIIYRKEEISENCVKIAFDVYSRLKSQCIAFDFIFINNNPLIVEISFGFKSSGYDKCEGYWDRDLLWHSDSFNPYGWMIEELLN